MSAPELPESTGLDDRVPFLARLERDDRAAPPALGGALRFAPVPRSSTSANRPPMYC